MWYNCYLHEHGQFSMGALVHRFFIEPVYPYVADTDTVSALGVGARHYGFRKTSQSY